MSAYYFSARFVPLDDSNTTRVVRHNTRLWFTRPESPLYRGNCVGAVVGLNPGSAIGQNYLLGDTIGICDRTMDRILKTFVFAYQLKNKSIPSGSYVQMLNLFYLREHISSLALAEREQRSVLVLSHQDPAELQTYPFLWLAWGCSARNADMARFLGNRLEKCCWIGADLGFHFDRPNHAHLVRHPLCRVAGFSMQRNAKMISQMLG